MSFVFRSLAQVVVLALLTRGAAGFILSARKARPERVREL